MYFCLFFPWREPGWRSHQCKILMPQSDLVLACFSLAFGRYSLGYTSPVKDTLQDEHKGIGISQGEQDIFGSIVNVGAMVGAMAAGVLLDGLGRLRCVLWFCSCLSLLPLSLFLIFMSRCSRLPCV